MDIFSHDWKGMFHNETIHLPMRLNQFHVSLGCQSQYHAPSEMLTPHASGWAV